MRLVVTDRAKTFVIAIIDLNNVSMVIDNPSYVGTYMGWSTNESIFEGYAPPDQMDDFDPNNPVPPTQATLAQYAASIRYDLEQGGALYNGWPVDTSDRSKLLINGELSAVLIGVRKDGEYFKFSDGIPRPLSNDQIKDLATTVRNFVAAAFAKETMCQLGIASGSMNTKADVDKIFTN